MRDKWKETWMAAYITMQRAKDNEPSAKKDEPVKIFVL
jgi:hypothetical protein